MRDYELSTRLFHSGDRRRICLAVSFSMGLVVPPQHGHGQVVAGGGVVVGIAERGRGASASTRRLTAMYSRRRRADRKPKWRMRTKPRGNTCSRNRRRNSSVVTVILRFL